METIKRIYTLLHHGNGLKIREISKVLELDAYYVADVLFSTDCIQYWYQNDSSLWFAKEGALEIEEPQREDTLTNNVIIPQNINKDSYLINESEYSLRIYIEEISKYRVYSEEEINELFTRFRNGDSAAYNLIVKSHLRLVANIARLYKSKGLHLADLIQEGNIGLLKAIERFDQTRNNRFIEFAKAWILQGISTSIMNLQNIVRFPQNQIQLHRKLQKFKDKFEQEYEYSPSFNEIHIDVDKESLKKVYDYPRELKDIAVYVDNWEEHKDHNNPPPDYSLLLESDNYFVNNLLHSLNKREVSILKSYFGIDLPIQETLNTIGENHNLTRERARQIVFSTIKKLQAKVGILTEEEIDNK